MQDSLGAGSLPPCAKCNKKINGDFGYAWCDFCIHAGHGPVVFCHEHVGLVKAERDEKANAEVFICIKCREARDKPKESGKNKRTIANSSESIKITKVPSSPEPEIVEELEDPMLTEFEQVTRDNNNLKKLWPEYSDKNNKQKIPDADVFARWKEERKSAARTKGV